MVVGDFADKNVIAFEVFGNDVRAANDFAGAGFNGLLAFGVAIHVVDAVLERGGSYVVKETGEGLFLVVGEMPDDESDTDAVCEDVVEILEIEDTTIIETNHTNTGEALHLWGGNIFEEPCREFWREDFEVCASFRCETA